MYKLHLINSLGEKEFTTTYQEKEALLQRLAASTLDNLLAMAAGTKIEITFGEDAYEILRQEEN